jgi:UDP-GlcNAc3NAcA epimerase
VKKIVAIVGARPQFIKHAPFELACKGRVELVSIHTGQHYDAAMSAVFFNQLGMQSPGYQIDEGKSYAEIEDIIVGILKAEKPEMVVVYGDTFSTRAGADAAKRCGISIAHVEAGLRSHNLQMPEEGIRIRVDKVSTWLFAPTQIAVQSLENEGITQNVHMVGDIMRDALQVFKKKISRKGERTYPYVYATLHRPYNVDDATRLRAILTEFSSLKFAVVLALHPRTKQRCADFGIQLKDFVGVEVIEPQPYLENLSLMKNAKAVITDSGGMQKEAYWLKKKCITLRSETEWPETLEGGANHLVFDDLSLIEKKISEPAQWKRGLYGDGRTAQRILDILLNT